MAWSSDNRVSPGLYSRHTLLARSSIAALLVLFGIGLALLAWLDSGASSIFHAHGYCYLWRSDLVIGHVTSDLLIGLSYVAISVTLWHLVRRAGGAIPFSWMFVAFGAFIIACGGTHFMEIITLWRPLFWTSMDVKIVTAVASVITAVALPPLVPKIVALLESARLSEERRLALETARDELSLRVETEHQLRLASEAASLKKDEFLANMSHELRTPLNSIIGFAEIMHDGKLGPIPAEHKEYLGDILASAGHLLHLINDVLDLSKVSSGRMAFFPETVDVRSSMEELAGLVLPIAGRKQIGIEIDVPQQMPPVVVDRAKLKQVLYNYVSNALKFTPEGGHVVLRARPEDERQFRVEVQDNGVGIRDDDLDRLFVEFEQLDTSAAKHFQGTGLGLALTKRLVEAQGGCVGVRSAPGEGSVFYALLPWVTSAVTAAGVQERPAP